MKKVFVLVVFFSLFGLCIGQEQTGTVQVEAKIDGNQVAEANADISQIDIDFCGTPGKKSILYTLPKGGKQDICMEARNGSDRDIEIHIGFVDGVLTNDQEKNRACMQEGENTKFGQYVTGFTTSFIVPASGSITQHANFQSPKNSTGSMLGCLTYYTKPAPAQDHKQVSFAILMRKAKFIDIHLLNETVRSNSKGGSVKIILGIIIILVVIGVVASIYVSKRNVPTKKATKPHGK